VTPLKKALSAWILETLGHLGSSVTPAEAENSLEVPREEKFGDLSTNLILKLAKVIKKPPRAMADEWAMKLNASLNISPLKGRLDKVSVEGPGFVNFYLSAAELSGVLAQIKKAGPDFGKPSVPRRKILLEFVSANPTGPLTVAHGRQAALGDSLARILRFCGHEVTTEYYNNDEGVQIETLGRSTLLRARELVEKKAIEIPENFYRGAYLADTAGKLIKAFPDILKDPAAGSKASDFAADDIMVGIKKDLADFDVSFENIYSQKALGKSGKVEKTLEELKKKGKVFESEGAVWLRSTEYGDDKDRVLVKSDKTYTYLTPDIAYHHEKFARGFEEIIDILGPDHHGYIARLKASQAALGHDPEKVHVLIAQLVTLFEGGQQVRMSTRAGEFVTLRQILEEVGKDAGRFFFVMRKFDAHLDFDLALAKSQTPENPVFYIQYAHARIESIKTKAREEGVRLPDLVDVGATGRSPLLRLGNAQELRVLRLLSQFEDNILGAERTLEPYRLVPYLMELASGFHKFYADNRVVSEEASLTKARLLLAGGVQQVIRTGLGLLGVSAPTKM